MGYGKQHLTSLLIFLGTALGLGSLLRILRRVLFAQKAVTGSNTLKNNASEGEEGSVSLKAEADLLAEDRDPSPSTSLTSSISESSSLVQSPLDNTLKQSSDFENSDLLDAPDQFNFVGIQNQGATCYLNSLLQTLCHISAFRKALYQIPDDCQDQIAIALRRVFYNLQYGGYTVSTNDLLKSFGWNTSDAYVQQDVQEVTRVLLERLEMTIKNTISSLFEGKLKNYIKCMHVNYESSRTEPFYDLQLTINTRDCQKLLQSFKHYTKEELLTGNNRYDAGAEHGLQDARKGCVFTQLPPVLMLHLKRFEYNFLTGAMYKINDYFEFDKDVDFSPFVERPADVSPEQHARDNEYRLFSVFVHTGTVNSGHYYVYINLPSYLPSNGAAEIDFADKWYKFNDDTVAEVTEEAAIQSNYGGNMWSAYMLVYIRKRDMPQIVSRYRMSDMKPALREQLANEQKSRCVVM